MTGTLRAESAGAGLAAAGAGLAASAGAPFPAGADVADGAAAARFTKPWACNASLNWLSGMASGTPSASRKAASSLSVSGSPADTDTLSCSLTSGAALAVNT